MFGYVKPYTPEMKIREYDSYRGIYCGLCRSMGAATGCLSRLTLNYDFVFLTSLRMLVNETKPCPNFHRCAVHPAKKRLIMDGNDEFKYASCVSALLVRAKIRDDRTDERGIKKIQSTFSLPFANSMVKKAEKSYNEDIMTEVGKIIDTSLEKLSSLERAHCPSLDETAECFGELTGGIFSAGLDEKKKRLLYEAGRITGRFIYVADAAADAAEDMKKKRYNPILELWGSSALVNDGKKSVLSDEVKESVMTASLLDLNRLSLASELICDSGDASLASIIRNIIYLGMPERLKQILNKNPTKPQTTSQP